VISIGVTGHRFLAEVDKLQAGIDLALARIDQRFKPEDWSVISSLAEGADRLVVDRILAYRPLTRLVVPIPLPVKDYQTDFSSEESTGHFLRLMGLASEIVQLPSATSRDLAYRASGEYILNHATVLIALWDGQGAQGNGGTGEMVALARQRRMPIAWVHAGNRIPGTDKPCSLGPDQGSLSFEQI